MMYSIQLAASFFCSHYGFVRYANTKEPTHFRLWTTNENKKIGDIKRIQKKAKSLEKPEFHSKLIFLPLNIYKELIYMC